MDDMIIDSDQMPLEERLEEQPQIPVQPKKSKRGLILAIGIPVLAVLIIAGVIAGMFVSKHLQYTDALEMLDDGKIEDAIEVHQELGDYKDLAEQICSAAEEQCKKLLKKESYGKVAKLYTAVEAYPDAIAQMDKQLEKHVKDLLKDGEIETVLEAYEEFTDHPTAVEMIEKQLGEAMAKYLDEGSEYADVLWMTLEEQDQELDTVNQAVYEYACDLMEQEEYGSAQGIFGLLDDYLDSREKVREIDFIWAVEELKECILYGWYSDAKYVVDSWDGEEHQKLLEIYLAACGDSTFLQDLETALTARIDLSNNGGTELDVVNAEWGMLEKYVDMPFYDDRLGELADAYLNALAGQQGAMEYWYASDAADYTETYYYWHYFAGERYLVLDQLRQEYGFNPQNPEIQALFGTGEAVKTYAGVWYEINIMLADQLWGIAPYLNADGQYCLDVYNYTDYSFSMYVYQSFHDAYDNELAAFDGDYLNIEPGDKLQVIIGYPEGDVSYWYIDWEIYDIFKDGVQIIN